MNITPENDPRAEAQDLIWALLDEQISDFDFKRLEAMLRDDEEVRRLYLQCVQMHVDLHQWSGGREDAASHRCAGVSLDLPLSSGDSPLTDLAF